MLLTYPVFNFGLLLTLSVMIHACSVSIIGSGSEYRIDNKVRNLRLLVTFCLANLFTDGDTWEEGILMV